MLAVGVKERLFCGLTNTGKKTHPEKGAFHNLDQSLTWLLRSTIQATVLTLICKISVGIS